MTRLLALLALLLALWATAAHAEGEASDELHVTIVTAETLDFHLARLPPAWGITADQVRIGAPLPRGCTDEEPEAVGCYVSRTRTIWLPAAARLHQLVHEAAHAAYFAGHLDRGMWSRFWARYGRKGEAVTWYATCSLHENYAETIAHYWSSRSSADEVEQLAPWLYNKLLKQLGPSPWWIPWGTDDSTIISRKARAGVR